MVELIDELEAHDLVVAEENRISAAALDEERDLLERFSRFERDQSQEREGPPIRTRDEALARKMSRPRGATS